MLLTYCWNLKAFRAKGYKKVMRTITCINDGAPDLRYLFSALTVHLDRCSNRSGTESARTDLFGIPSWSQCPLAPSILQRRLCN